MDGQLKAWREMQQRRRRRSEKTSREKKKNGQRAPEWKEGAWKREGRQGARDAEGQEHSWHVDKEGRSSETKGRRPTDVAEGEAEEQKAPGRGQRKEGMEWRLHEKGTKTEAETKQMDKKMKEQRRAMKGRGGPQGADDKMGAGQSGVHCTSVGRRRRGQRGTHRGRGGGKGKRRGAGRKEVRRREEAPCRLRKTTRHITVCAPRGSKGASDAGTG